MRQISIIIILIAFLVVNCKKTKPVTVDTVTTSPVTNITANSAMTGGTITDGGNLPLSHEGICWATHPQPTISDSITDGGFGYPDFTVQLSNLNANTTYFIRAYAENEAGVGYGNEISFMTGIGAPTVTTAAVTSNQSLQVVTGGEVTNSGGDTVTAMGICWSVNPHPTTSDSTILNPNPGMGSFVDTISNLVIGATYYVRAFATNNFGTTYGNEINFTVSDVGTVTDIDGNIYPTVTIGSQTWMTMNLRVTRYQNGDTILNGSSGYDWVDSTTGAYTFPNGDSINNEAFGKLYNTYAINDLRNIAPQGWHVAADLDWQLLELYEGMDPADTGAVNVRGTIGGKLLQGGTSGLNLVNAGALDPSTNSFLYFSSEGYYWSSTNFAPGLNWFRAFNTVGGDPGPIYRGYNNWVQSVRCVKN